MALNGFVFFSVSLFVFFKLRVCTLCLVSSMLILRFCPSFSSLSTMRSRGPFLVSEIAEMVLLGELTL